MFTDIMKYRLFTPVYTLTLFLSAFLLFSVQPLLGKIMLPYLGGTASVWNTAMLFFQLMLLGGYIYAHLLAKMLPLRAQVILHTVLLVCFALLLPVTISSADWQPPATSNPVFWQLITMTAIIGGPFFVLAASAPMLQHWFTHTSHPESQNPYFLYASSNFGSMVALLAYPVLIAPLMTLDIQSQGWAIGYGLLIACTVLSALLVWNKKEIELPSEKIDAPPVPWRTRLYWIFLAFVPSSLMLGVTTYITTDLASVPLIWIVPLAMYLLTFIIAFSRSYTPPMKIVQFLHALLLLGALGIFMSITTLQASYVIVLHLVLFFISALLCHTALANARPAASHLTEFYLMIALGGVMGGMFNALIAPLIFPIPLEYALALGLICFARTPREGNAKSFRDFLHELKASLIIWKSKNPTLWLILLAITGGVVVLTLPPGQYKIIVSVISCLLVFLLRKKKWAFALTASALLLLHPGFNWKDLSRITYIKRNYFGVIRVYDIPEVNARILSHGSTTHGAQQFTPPHEFMPLSYYHPFGPAGDIFNLLNTKPGTQKIAAIGLGVGSIACYSLPARSFDFYEIDPDMADVAQNPKLFTFLSGCGSPYDIIIGDGRLKIAEAPDDYYDLIFLDAYSSDGIPVNLITKEAFELYKKKLKKDGLIVVHLSNRFIDLKPVLSAIARDLGDGVLFKTSGNQRPNIKEFYFMTEASYGVYSSTQGLLDFLSQNGWKPRSITDKQKAWTDDYASLIGLIHW